MTQYEKPSFSVPTGKREAANCEHGWLDRWGVCVFCGWSADPVDVLDMKWAEYREKHGLPSPPEA